MVQGLDVEIGSPISQSFWEFYTLLLVLLVWCPDGAATKLNIVGDNTRALQQALALKGRGPMLDISREIARRRARRNWHFHVGHLPSERNKVADALSRRTAPDAAKSPKELRQGQQRKLPE